MTRACPTCLKDPLLAYSHSKRSQKRGRVVRLSSSSATKVKSRKGPTIPEKNKIKLLISPLRNPITTTFMLCLTNYLQMNIEHAFPLLIDRKQIPIGLSLIFVQTENIFFLNTLSGGLTWNEMILEGSKVCPQRHDLICHLQPHISVLLQDSLSFAVCHGGCLQLKTLLVDKQDGLLE